MRGGRRIRGEHFSVYASPNTQPYGRIGLTVSRKVSPRAVVRNRLKRRIRESFRLNQERLTGLDIVVLAHACAAAATPQSLRDSLEQHWEEIIRLCKKS